MRRTLLCLAAMLAAQFAAAASIRLDDSASPKARFDLQPGWQYEGEEIGDADRLNALVARASAVEVRLNTAAIVGKRGRIFIVLPQNIAGLDSPDALRMQWTARGPFKSGTVLPGGRTLLYDGLVDSPLTRDVLDFTIFFDARHTPGGLRLETYFEFDPAS